MVTKSTGFKQSSIMEIHSIAGVPFDKIVVGKPLSAVTASNGWALLTCHCLSNSGCSGMMDAATLKGCLANAKAQGWNGGVMIWEWALVNSLDIALPLATPCKSPLSSLFPFPFPCCSYPADVVPLQGAQAFIKEVVR